MKILHFYKTAWPDTTGGVEEMIHQLSAQLVDFGVDVDVLTLSNTKKSVELIAGYNLYRSPLNFSLASTNFSFKVFRDFKRLSMQADLIHYHFPWPFMDLVHFISASNKPYIVTYHSDIVKQKNLLRLYKPLMDKFLKNATKIIATSPQYAKSSEVLKKYQDRVDIIPIGLNKTKYSLPSIDNLEKWRRSLNFSDDKFYLFIGVLRYYKGLEYLIEAAKITKLPVVIAGDGPLMQTLQRQAQGYDNIKFLGFLSSEDKIALLTLCRAFIFPSHLRSEAFGISLLEAAMFGKPMISTEINTGTSFINKHEHTGLVVQPASKDALAKAMQTLWGKDDLIVTYGNNAQARYQEYFTSEIMAQKYLDLYSRVLL